MAVGSRGLTAEAIVGAVTGIIVLLLFLDVPAVWKILGVLVLAVQGGMILLASLNVFSRSSRYLESRAREIAIRRHADLIGELYRFSTAIYRILYERSEDHPSLRREGERILHETDPGGINEFEFEQKMAILMPIYSDIKTRIETLRGRSYRRWTSLEFSGFVGEIDTHLSVVVFVFDPVYRGAQTRPPGSPVPGHLARNWGRFCTDFNGLVQDWRHFVDRVVEVTKYGGESRARPAEMLA